jgi:tetratricopeptide (TPR) repeat protein
MEKGAILKTRFAWIFLCTWCVLIFFLFPSAWALKVNADGQALVREASQAYATDMRDHPIVTNPQVKGYVKQLSRRLVPKGKRPPPGVNLTVTVIESKRPELYSYVDGHVVMTTGMLFAMDNEAQLAGVLAQEIAQVVEGYYISMYQEIKAAERRQRGKAAAGALLSSLLDVAVDYALEMQEVKEMDRLFSGERTYRETLKRMAAMSATRGAYYSIRDVIESIPAKDTTGQWIDPRQRFEAVADAQGMEYLALAGYDTAEATRGWENVLRINGILAREQEQALGALASQMRATQSMMELSMHRLRQSLGASGLVQTLSVAPASRAQFVSKLTQLEEVRAAAKLHGSKKARSEYMSLVRKVLLPRAEEALREERYEQAHRDYRVLYDKGERSAPIAYGMAKSKLGDFAFGASLAEKEEAERHYREAARLDTKYAMPYKGLGELYEDWERYEDAVKAYSKYLKLAPNDVDKKRIGRKIKVLKRKASR